MAQTSDGRKRVYVHGYEYINNHGTLVKVENGYRTPPCPSCRKRKIKQKGDGDKRVN